MLEYDGTRYAGSQLQPGRRTVQGELEKAIEGLLGRRARASFAGRTDAGVHARGQVASFAGEFAHTPETVRGALNAWLPEDLGVRAAAEVEPAFDVRRRAVARWYRYTVLPSRDRAPLERGRTWQIRGRPDAGVMQEAATYLVGRHDLRAFAALPSRPGASMVREITRAAVTVHEGRLWIDLEGNAFLPHQVRLMAGALVWVGLGRDSVERFAALVEGGGQGAARPMAPPQGLCLMRVSYRGLSFDADQETDTGYL